MTELMVTTAFPLSENKKKELERTFAEKYGEFTVNYVVNDAILGGMILFDGTKVYNGSVVKQLENFEKIVKGVKA